jgi:outer membrane lipoprotein SlyB
MSDSGTLSSGSYVLDLQSIRVNGRRYIVNTEDVKKGETGIGANRRTAEYVGGGAALGTLLGAIAGGGKGAAIGAIAGAAAGGGVQVLTKGKEIRVPAETVLNFRLEEPLHLREG